MRGGPPTDHDLDFLIKPEDAERALAVLADAGLRPERPPEEWLFKAFDGDVMVDLIFNPAGLEMTDEVLERGEALEVEAMTMRVMRPEDLLVTKLMAMTEHTLNYRSCLEIARALREQIDWNGRPPAHRLLAVRPRLLRDRRRARGCLGRVAQRLDLAQHRQRLERVRLDLPHPLARDPEPLADRLERQRLVVAVEPVAQLRAPCCSRSGSSSSALRSVSSREADLDLLLGARLVGREEVAVATPESSSPIGGRGSSPRARPP